MVKKKDEITIRSSAAEYLTYVASVGDQQDSIEMRYEDENMWLTQKMMATLYDVGLPTINEHIKKIYADSELEEAATIRNFRIVQTEGSRQVTRDTKHYNLQMIIAVGFKVNNEQAVQFRKWTNGIVKDYPTVNLSMKKTGGIFHDRFIVLDYGTADERVFLCGASSKDAGARITSIVEDYGISKYAPVIATLLKNSTLILPQ